MRLRFLFFGDSICAGSNIPGDGDPSRAWPWLVPDLVQAPMDVVNSSRGGRPTAALDEFREALAHAGAVDALVIALAGNDSRDFAGRCVENAVSNVRTMLALAREAEIARLIVVGPYDMNAACWNSDDASRAQRVRNLLALDQAYRELCADEGIEFVPMYGVVPEESMTFDGVHPDACGNEPIAKRFTEIVFGED